MLQASKVIVPEPVLFTTIMLDVVPPMLAFNNVKDPPVTLSKFAVPGRKSVVISQLAAMVKPPPPDAPAEALFKFVSVARARAWPVPLPAPVARKTMPTVLAAAPMLVKFVEPTVVISYHWPETNEPALTMGLLAPPIEMFWLITTEKPLE